MRLSKKQREKISDICEKLGVTVFIASIGDAFIGTPGRYKFVLDIVGISIGLTLLVISVFILREEEDE